MFITIKWSCIFYTLWLTFFHTFAPAGNSKCFRNRPAPTPAGIYRHKAIAFTLLPCLQSQ